MFKKVIAVVGLILGMTVATVAEPVKANHSTCTSFAQGGSFYRDCNGGSGIYYAKAYYYYFKNGVAYYGTAWGSAAQVPAASRGCVTWTRVCNYRWTQCPVSTGCTVYSVVGSHG